MCVYKREGQWTEKEGESEGGHECIFFPPVNDFGHWATSVSAQPTASSEDGLLLIGLGWAAPAIAGGESALT